MTSLFRRSVTSIRFCYAWIQSWVERLADCSEQPALLPTPQHVTEGRVDESLHLALLVRLSSFPPAWAAATAPNDIEDNCGRRRTEEIWLLCSPRAALPFIALLCRGLQVLSLLDGDFGLSGRDGVGSWAAAVTAAPSAAGGSGVDGGHASEDGF